MSPVHSKPNESLFSVRKSQPGQFLDMFKKNYDERDPVLFFRQKHIVMKIVSPK